MSQSNETNLPDGLDEVAEHLHLNRYEVSPLELDQLKRHTMAQAARVTRSRRGKGQFVRSKLITLMLVLGLAITGGSAGVLAGGGGGGGGNAGHSQYCDDDDDRGGRFCPDDDDDDGHGNGGGGHGDDDDDDGKKGKKGGKKK